MPRVESTKHLGASAQYYHSQFTNSQYLADSSASPPQSPASQQSPQPSPASTGPASKKKHICQICDRAFTTSGHLARHSRVHTGERNHKCPFPGCETRCSRQDNLQQHYRIHLSPGSRRSSNRAAKGSSKKAAAAAAASNPSPPAEPVPSTPPLSSPPALEPARIYNHHSTPPDATPPLAQATLPATATLPMTAASRMDTASDRSSPGGSPHASYSNAHHHVGPMSSQAGQHFSGNNGTAPYSYRNGTSTYQEQSQSQGSNPAFTYVHTTPISSASTSSNNAGGSYPAYSTNQDGFANHPIHNPHTQNRSPPLSMSSRHSISHISHPHPQPYPQSQQQQQQQQHHHQSTSAGPASPASSHSVSSHTSGPPTPTYPVYDDGAHTTYSNGNANSMIGDHNAGYAAPSQQSHIIPAGYSSNVQSANNGRFDSPPPILAPIQDERLIRREDRHSVSHSHSQHNTSPYIHHPQPLPTDYPYHQSLGLGHGAWKGESAIRKNVGTALV